MAKLNFLLSYEPDKYGAKYIWLTSSNDKCKKLYAELAYKTPNNPLHYVVNGVPATDLLSPSLEKKLTAFEVISYNSQPSAFDIPLIWGFNQDQCLQNGLPFDQSKMILFWIAHVQKTDPATYIHFGIKAIDLLSEDPLTQSKAKMAYIDKIDPREALDDQLLTHITDEEKKEDMYECVNQEVVVKKKVDSSIPIDESTTVELLTNHLLEYIISHPKSSMSIQQVLFAKTHESVEELAKSLVGLDDVELIHDLVDYCHKMAKTSTGDAAPALRILKARMLHFMAEHLDVDIEQKIGEVIYTKQHQSSQELMHDFVDLEDHDLNLELVGICCNKEYLDTL